MVRIHQVYLPRAPPRRLMLCLGLINQHARSQRQMPTLLQSTPGGQSTPGAEDWGVEDPVLHIWLKYIESILGPRILEHFCCIPAVFQVILGYMF